MSSNDWEKEQRHRELLNSQRDIQNAIESQSFSEWENTQDLIAAIEEDREFRLFWDTLSRAEKKQWLEEREEERRLEAIALEAEEKRQTKARERQEAIHFYSGSDFRVSRFWLIILSMSFGGILTFGLQLIFGSLVLSIPFGVLAAIVTLGILVTKKFKAQYETLLTSRLDNSGHLTKSLIAEINSKIEENRQNIDSSIFKTITRGLFVLPFSLLTTICLVLPLAGAASHAIETSNDRSEAIKILTALNTKKGHELTYFITASMPSGTISNPGEWNHFKNFLDLSSYEIQANLNDAKMTFSEVPYFPSSSSDVMQCATANTSTDSRLYTLETETSFISSRSNERTERNVFLFVKEKDGQLYPFIDICGLTYWYTAFFNREQTENVLFDRFLSASTSYWNYSVSCPDHLFGTVGQAFECAVLNPSGELAGRIQATIAQLNPPGFTSIWLNVD